MTINHRWEHREKQRYYRVCLNKDLFGQWIVTRVWGGINQATGRISHLLCQSYEDGLKTVELIGHVRLKRGYILCENFVAIPQE